MMTRGVRDFPGRRWLSVLLRGAHLVAVIWFGAGVLLASPDAGATGAGIAVVLSGLALWLLDLWHRPAHLLEGAGLGMVLKLGLLAAMVAVPALRVPLFWVIVAWSAVFSHAPSSFRNASPWHARADGARRASKATKAGNA